MKRRWNLSLWVGFIFVLAGLLTYPIRIRCFPLLGQRSFDAYGLSHPGAGPKGADIARPAEFLIDSSGTIPWVNLTENIAVRARPDQVLKAFDEVNGSGAR